MSKKKFKPLEVEVKGTNVMGAYRKLRKELGKEGFIYELKRREFYSKPSEARREKKERAERRRRKKERNSNDR